MAASYTVFLAAEAAAEFSVTMVWWRKNRPAAPSLFQDELKQALLNIAAHLGIGARSNGGKHSRFVTSALPGVSNERPNWLWRLDL